MQISETFVTNLQNAMNVLRSMGETIVSAEKIAAPRWKGNEG